MDKKPAALAQMTSATTATQKHVSECVLVEQVEPRLPTAVVFSSVNANWYSHYNLFAKLPCNRIFVRDLKDSWFVEGITGADTPKDIAAVIKAELKELKSTDVITFGSSMGGYGALLFAPSLKARVVAVSPQTLIDPRLPHTPKKKYGGPFFDLNKSIALGPDQPTTIFYGGADLVDAYNALRFTGAENLTRIGVANEDHLVAAVLARDGHSQEAIRAGLAGEPYSFTGEADAYCNDPVVADLVIKTVEGYYLGLGDPDESARILCEMHPNWAAPWFILAQHAADRRDWASAETSAEKAAKLAPRSVTYADYYASILLKLTKDEEAIAAYKATLALRPKQYSALCALAALEAKRGEKDEALRLLEIAIDIRPRLTRAQKMRDQLLAGKKIEMAQVELASDKNVL